MGIHLLHCAHGNEHKGTHDVIHNSFATIARNANSHMGQEQLHVLPFAMSNSSCRQVDVVFTKNGIHTVVDVVIANPTQVNLFFQSCTIQRFVAFNATQAKERGYHN